MKKIILYYDDNSGVYDKNNNYIGTLNASDAEDYHESLRSYCAKSTVVRLIENGVSTDDIVKLKNNDLL